MQEMTQQRHSSEKRGRDRERIERKEYNSLRSESESEKAAEKKRLQKGEGRESKRERESEGQASKREMKLRKKDVTFQPLRRINQAKLLKTVLKYRTTATATQVIEIIEPDSCVDKLKRSD